MRKDRVLGVLPYRAGNIKPQESTKAQNIYVIFYG
jgi:hypothetical protein